MLALEQDGRTQLGRSASSQGTEVPEFLWDKLALPSSMCGHMAFCLRVCVCLCVCKHISPAGCVWESPVLLSQPVTRGRVAWGSEIRDCASLDRGQSNAEKSITFPAQSRRSPPGTESCLIRPFTVSVYCCYRKQAETTTLSKFATTWGHEKASHWKVMDTETNIFYLRYKLMLKLTSLSYWLQFFCTYYSNEKSWSS